MQCSATAQSESLSRRRLHLHLGLLRRGSHRLSTLLSALPHVLGRCFQLLLVRQHSQPPPHHCEQHVRVCLGVCRRWSCCLFRLLLHLPHMCSASQQLHELQRGPNPFSGSLQLQHGNIPKLFGTLSELRAFVCNLYGVKHNVSLVSRGFLPHSVGFELSVHIGVHGDKHSLLSAVLLHLRCVQPVGFCLLSVSCKLLPHLQLCGLNVSVQQRILRQRWQHCLSSVQLCLSHVYALLAVSHLRRCAAANVELINPNVSLQCRLLRQRISAVRCVPFLMRDLLGGTQLELPHVSCGESVCEFLVSLRNGHLRRSGSVFGVFPLMSHVCSQRQQLHFVREWQLFAQQSVSLQHRLLPQWQRLQCLRYRMRLMRSHCFCLHCVQSCTGHSPQRLFVSVSLSHLPQRFFCLPKLRLPLSHLFDSSENLSQLRRSKPPHS